MSVRTLTNGTNTSRNTGRSVKSPICIYIRLVLCQLTGILKLKGEKGTMKRLVLAIALASVLSGVARGGEIHSTGAVPPPPPQPVTAAGEIYTTEATAPEASSTLLTVILTLIDIVR